MNKYLAYFPVEDAGTPATPMSDEEILDIINASLPQNWTLTMLSNNIRVDDFDDLTEAVDHYTALYQTDQMYQQLNGHENGQKFKKDKEKAKRIDCPHCGKLHVGPASKCWTLEENKDKRPKNYKDQSLRKSSDGNDNSNKKRKSTVTFTEEQFAHFIKAFPASIAAANNNKKNTKSSMMKMKLLEHLWPA